MEKNKRTITEIRESKQSGEKMVYMSVPDYTSAQWAQMGGIDVAVVGDSLAMIAHGHPNTIRRHHTAHHNSRLMMEKNMNLTFPISDWLFGTSDLDRGLLGHLFNGYDESYLKGNLRGQPRRPDIAAAEPIAFES